MANHIPNPSRYFSKSKYFGLKVGILAESQAKVGATYNEVEDQDMQRFDEK